MHGNICEGPYYLLQINLLYITADHFPNPAVVFEMFVCLVPSVHVAIGCHSLCCAMKIEK